MACAALLITLVADATTTVMVVNAAAQTISFKDTDTFAVTMITLGVDADRIIISSMADTCRNS